MRFVILFLAIVLLSTVVGKAVVAFLQLKQVRHESVYGVFVYILGFFILSFLAIITGQSWALFYVIVLLYTFGLFGVALFYNLRGKRPLPIKWSRILDKVWNNLLMNWHIYLLTTIFTILCLTSATTNYFSYSAFSDMIASTDEYYYLGKTTEFMQADSVNLIFRNVVSGQDGSFDIQMFNAYYEMFWSFLTQVTGLNLLTITHSVLPGLIYFIFFLLLDELLYVLAGKKYMQIRYSLFVLLLLYLSAGMQLEYAKLMYLPWYGNVITTFMFIPFALLFTYQALDNRKLLVFVMTLPFVMTGFNLGAVAATLFIYPIVTLFWWKNRTEKRQNDRLIVLALHAIVLLFLCATLLQFYLVLGEETPSIDLIRSMAVQAEYYYLRDVLRGRLFLMLPGLIGISYKLLFKKANAVERYVIVYTIIVLFILMVRPIGELVSGLAGFGLRRILESSILCLILYSIITLLSIFPIKKWETKILLPIIVALVTVFNYGSYITNKTYIFQAEHLQNLERLHPVAKDFYDFLQSDEEVRRFCKETLWMPVEEDSNAFDEAIFVDFQTIVGADKESKSVDCSTGVLADTAIFYLVATDDLVQQQYLASQGARVVRTFESSELTVLLYEQTVAVNA